MFKNYERVIARDLFNESKLLKCVGHLALAIHQGRIDLKVGRIGKSPAFKIRQDQSEGSIHVANLVFTVTTCDGVERLHVYTPLNSRKVYPLLAKLYNGEDEVGVFTESGELTSEFIWWIDSLTESDEESCEND